MIDNQMMLQKWFAMNPQLLWAYEGAVIPPHQHYMGLHHTDELNAWYILHGGVRVVSDPAILSAQPGQWLLFGGRFYRQDFTENARLLSVRFRIKGFESASMLPEIVQGKSYPNLERKARSLIACIKKFHLAIPTDLLYHQVEEEDFFKLSGRFFRWLEEYFKVCGAIGASLIMPQNINPRVAQAMEELTSESLTLPGSTTARLAQSVGVTPGHLDRLFIHEFGATPRLLREKRRLEEARQQVAHGDTPFKRLAYDLGFSSPAHFSNWFRTHFQMSPRQYRIQHSNDAE